jgi:2'-5' RNA ligase
MKPRSLRRAGFSGSGDTVTKQPRGKVTTMNRTSALHHEESNETGIAIVLTIPEEQARSIAMEGGTPTDQLHVTLGYFGDITEIENPEYAESTLEMITSELGLSYGKFDARLGGLIRFTGEEQDAFALSADSVMFNAIRDRMVEILPADLLPDATHGFTPHMTLGYLDSDDPMPIQGWVAQDVLVTNVELWFGGHRFVMPLNDPPVKGSKKTTSQRYAERLARLR